MLLKIDNCRELLIIKKNSLGQKHLYQSIKITFMRKSIIQD
jgi:hypothetical protein